MDVLYYKAFGKMGYKAGCLAPSRKLSMVSTNTFVLLDGTIKIKVSLRVKKSRFSKMTQFVVVRLDSAYNALFG